MERAVGIEPTLTAWEAVVLPLYYARTAPGSAEVRRGRVALLKGGRLTVRDGAAGGARTPDPLVTNQQLFQLSYSSIQKGRPFPVSLFLWLLPIINSIRKKCIMVYHLFRFRTFF